MGFLIRPDYTFMISHLVIRPIKGLNHGFFFFNLSSNPETWMTKGERSSRFYEWLLAKGICNLSIILFMIQKVLRIMIHIDHGFKINI